MVVIRRQSRLTGTMKVQRREYQNWPSTSDFLALLNSALPLSNIRAMVAEQHRQDQEELTRVKKSLDSALTLVYSICLFAMLGTVLTESPVLNIARKSISFQRLAVVRLLSGERGSSYVNSQDYLSFVYLTLAHSWFIWVERL